MAGTLHIELGIPSSIQTDAAYPIAMPRYYAATEYYAASLKTETVPTNPVVPGNQKIRAGVTLQFFYHLPASSWGEI